jgi:hypothetical protein
MFWTYDQPSNTVPPLDIVQFDASESRRGSRREALEGR